MSLNIHNQEDENFPVMDLYSSNVDLYNMDLKSLDDCTGPFSAFAYNQESKIAPKFISSGFFNSMESIRSLPEDKLLPTNPFPTLPSSSLLSNFNSMDEFLVPLLQGSRSFSLNEIMLDPTMGQTKESDNKWHTEFKEAFLDQPKTTALTPSKGKKGKVAKKSKKSNKAKSPRSRATRPRRVIPDKKEYIKEDKPTELDVVSGRGGVSTHHEGNKPYWRKVLARRAEYKSIGNDNERKRLIAQSIVDLIQDKKGRFVQKDKKTEKFFVLPDSVALDKVKQALRDNYTPLWAR